MQLRKEARKKKIFKTSTGSEPVNKLLLSCKGVFLALIRVHMCGILMLIKLYLFVL